ncbi:MAG: sensor histidine kinase [Bacteroidales bacterium]
MMLIKVGLLISVLLQIGATVLAISLIRKTRYNASWILISIAFVFMAFRRIYELFEVYTSPEFPHSLVTSWIDVVISLCVFTGTIFIRRIFEVQAELDKLKKQHEAKVLSAVIQTEEKNKRMFARTLHDGLGPILSSVKMMLSSVPGNKDKHETEQVIKKSEAGIDEAIESLKQISNLMNPHILESYGLIRAIDRIIAKYNETEKLQVLLQENLGTKRLNHKAELAAYRIVSELLNNTVQHARADEVTIHILLDNKDLRIIYSDNGQGFDMNTDHEGMGLSNIESRVKALNGECNIHSSHGKGFYADIKIKAL